MLGHASAAMTLDVYADRLDRAADRTAADSMQCVQVVDSMADQVKRLVGRAGFEPATEGL